MMYASLLVSLICVLCAPGKMGTLAMNWIGVPPTKLTVAPNRHEVPPGTAKTSSAVL
jgi:hypothetical protein